MVQTGARLQGNPLRKHRAFVNSDLFYDYVQTRSSAILIHQLPQIIGPAGQRVSDTAFASSLPPFENLCKLKKLYRPGQKFPSEIAQKIISCQVDNCVIFPPTTTAHGCRSYKYEAISPARPDITRLLRFRVILPRFCERSRSIRNIGRYYRVDFTTDNIKRVNLWVNFVCILPVITTRRIKE